jgi:hypothetical protein
MTSQIKIIRRLDDGERRTIPLVESQSQPSTFLVPVLFSTDEFESEGKEARSAELRSYPSGSFFD